jgi:hypothetical protein
MTLEHTTIERLQEIEVERAQTDADPNYQAWMQEFKVGILCKKNDGITRAQQIMADWNQSPLNKTLWE